MNTFNAIARTVGEHNLTVLSHLIDWKFTLERDIISNKLCGSEHSQTKLNDHAEVCIAIDHVHRFKCASPDAWKEASTNKPDEVQKGAFGILGKFEITIYTALLNITDLPLGKILSTIIAESNDNSGLEYSDVVLVSRLAQTAGNEELAEFYRPRFLKSDETPDSPEED